MSKSDRLTLAEAHRYAGVSLRIIYYAVEQGYIKIERLGPRTAWTTKAEVDRWLETPEYHVTGPKKKVARRRKKQYTVQSPSGDIASD